MAHEAEHFGLQPGPGEAPPAHLPARMRLEWEVAQLADGTLAPDRRAAVEAALVSDAELRESYGAHRRMEAMLRQVPALHADMAGIRDGILEAIAQEPAYGAPAPRRSVVAKSGGLADLMRGWWVTISAAAAALVIGLGVGTMSLGPGGVPVVDVGLPGTAAAGAQIDVAGPLAILRQQSHDDETELVALTVTGPDYRAILDPAAESPSYAFSYGSSAVIDTPSRLIIASASGEE